MKKFVILIITVFCLFAIAITGCIDDDEDREEDKGKLRIIFTNFGGFTELESGEETDFDLIVLNENDNVVNNVKISLSVDKGSFKESEGTTSYDKGIIHFSTLYTAPIVSSRTKINVTAKASKSGYESGEANVSFYIVPLLEPDEIIVATLEQGDGNMNEGCLFVLTKRSGENIEIINYRIKIGKEGESPETLKWPEDGNSSYSLDSGLKTNDGDWWDDTESMGFDAPVRLSGIEDGDRLEVSIMNMYSGDVVYSGSFIYQE